VDDFKSMSSRERFIYEHSIESERGWSSIKFNVCYYCKKCHLQNIVNKGSVDAKKKTKQSTLFVVVVTTNQQNIPEKK
jgi:hypothetical protein